MLRVNNGTSMRSPRLSRITNGSHTHLTFKETEPLPMSDAQLLTLDGGRCSDMRIISSGTKKVRYSISKEMLMLKTETSLFTKLPEE